MARKAQISAHGAVYYIMARGIEGSDIFCDVEDRNLILSFFSDGIHRNGYKCYAWLLDAGEACVKKLKIKVE